MSSKQEPETAANSSSDETATLLISQTANPPRICKLPSHNGPTLTQSHSLSASTHYTPPKPMLMRQDRTSTYLASPQLSVGLGTSEESAGGDDDTLNAHSVPDIELHCRVDTPKISISNSNSNSRNSNNSIGNQLVPANRCRTCRSYERRASISPVTQMVHSTSKESVRSGLHGQLSPSLTVQQQSGTNFAKIFTIVFYIFFNTKFLCR